MRSPWPLPLKVRMATPISRMCTSWNYHSGVRVAKMSCVMAFYGLLMMRFRKCDGSGISWYRHLIIITRTPLKCGCLNPYTTGFIAELLSRKIVAITDACRPPGMRSATKYGEIHRKNKQTTMKSVLVRDRSLFTPGGGMGFFNLFYQFFLGFPPNFC